MAKSEARETRATLGYCLRRPDWSMARGFTLLELVVVMALTALTVGLVVPAAQRGLDAARERGVRSDIQALLASLPVRAYQAGTPLRLDAQALRQQLPQLPEGWSLLMNRPLSYSAAGVASGGAVRLGVPGRATIVWRVEPVSGIVEFTDTVDVQ